MHQSRIAKITLNKSVLNPETFYIHTVNKYKTKSLKIIRKNALSSFFSNKFFIYHLFVQCKYSNNIFEISIKFTLFYIFSEMTEAYIFTNFENN